MKIALVILNADPARGGAERYTFDLSQALAGLGHEVVLLASRFGPAPAGVESLRLGKSALTRLGRYLRFIDAVDSHLADHPYDIVHAMLPVRRCHVYHPHAGLAAEAIVSGHRKHADRMRRALAAVSNQINVKRRSFARIERQLLQGPSAPVVLCLSDYVKQTVRRHFPQLPPEKLATLFNAVDLEKFDPLARPGERRETRRRLGVSEETPLALIIAQDFERKGLGEAIDALAECPQTHLVVVGKENPASYRERARAMGVDNRVHFAGATTDPYAYYAAADFFVLPTRHDPCSLVVLESLAMGVPVISTRQNGACEIMQSGRHGFVLERAADHAQLVHAMRQLSQEDIRHGMSQACLELRPSLAYQSHLRTLLSAYAQARASAAL